MKIEIVERNYDVGKRLQSLIEKKLKKLERYFPDDAKATVVCRQEKKNYIMEVSITNKNGFYRSEVTGENMFENLDMALPKVEKQIIRANQKRQNFKTQVEAPILEFLQELPTFEDKRIVKKKQIHLDPLDIEDAKYMLEATDHDFYAFLNRDSGKVNIVYNRKDGDVGLIELQY